MQRLPSSLKTEKIKGFSHLVQPLDNQIINDDNPLSLQPSVWILAGSAGSGKTSVLLNALSKFYRGKVNNIYLFSQTCYNDAQTKDIYQHLIDELDSEGKVYTEATNDNIAEVVDKIKDYNKSIMDEIKKKKKKIKPPLNLIIFDDVLRFFSRKSQSAMNELITNRRHLKTIVIVTTQKFRYIPPIIRSNMSYLSVFQFNNRKDVVGIDEEFEHFQHYYNDVMENNRISPKPFLHVSFINGTPIFYNCFDRYVK